MKSFRDRFYKPLLGLLILVLLGGVNRVHLRLYEDRVAMGLTKLAPPENLPPVLAFTTVALGGFRGLIANALWIRATDLQEKGKYFEMVQLADWITKLQPHIPTVWYHLGWNMSYNISIKFNDPNDRWLWVQRAIELLRDQALHYNPGETVLYRELSWFYQHKLGQNLDDAHLYYKEMLAKEMLDAFGPKMDYQRLINPATDEDRARRKIVTEKLKLDPAYMKEIDEHYGPLEWRLPEAHAIYWAKLGLDRGGNKDKDKVRRSIFQSMQTAFHRGRLIENKFYKRFEFGPNLEIIPNVSRAYEEAMEQDAELRSNFATGHRNFIMTAVYFLYLHNRQADANRWFKILKEKYPRPEYQNLSVDEYAVIQVTEQAGDLSQDRMKAVLQGLWETSFYNLAIGEDDQAVSYDRLAQNVYANYQRRTSESQHRVGLPPKDFLKRDVLNRLLEPGNPVSDEMKNVLRTKLGLAAGANTDALDPGKVEEQKPLVLPRNN